MKKTFLLFVAMFSLFFIGGGGLADLKAQNNVVTIPEDQDNYVTENIPSVPINNNYEYSISQCYYTKSMINKENGGTILNISFKTMNETIEDGISNYPYTRNIEIYLKKSSDETFSSKEMKVLSDEDRYFKGIVEFTAESWVNIELDKPYPYDGTNLLICINDQYNTDNNPNDSKDYVSPAAKFYTFSSGNTMRCLSHKNTSTKYDPTNSSVNNKSASFGNTGNIPFIRFTFESTTPSEETISLSANTQTIIANGSDEVNFTVTSSISEDVTNSCTFYQMTGTNPQGTDPVVTNPFTTTTAGTYQFYAKYGDLQSNPITITASEQTLTLEVNLYEIIADGSEEAVFTVKLDGETINSGYQIYKGTDPYNSNTFSTTEAGNYNFYARYTSGTKTLTSNTVAITASEQTLTLEVNLYEIIADGSEEAVFTVKLDGETINSGYQIYKGTDPYNSNTFSTTEAGNYNFYAEYNTGFKTLTSGNITVTAIEPQQEPDEPETTDYIEIYGTESGTSTSVPVNLYNSHSISQQYYLKDEINKDNATITSVSFSCDNIAGTSFETEVSVYMRNTTETSFSSKTMKQMNENELVYNGPVTFTSGTWCEIRLNNKFEYTGDNILLCVWEYVDGYTSGNDKSSFNTFYVETSRILHKNSGNNNKVSDPTTTENTNCNNTPYSVPQVKFGIEETQSLPLTIEASKDNILANGHDYVTFTVKQGEETLTEGYEIYYNGANKLNGNTFKTDNAGTYEFYAMKGTEQSNTVTVTAEKPIALSIASATETSVTFSVTQDGVPVNDAEIYIGDKKIDGYTFETTEAGTYLASAKKGNLMSEPIAVVVDNSVIGCVFYPNGSVTYNIGTERQYTLLITMDLATNEATIVEDNVHKYGSGNNVSYLPKDDNKPQAETTLIIPEKVLNGTEWITVTKIADYAFDGTFEDVYEPGNVLNNNFTSVIIPSTITEIGSFAFAFQMEGNVICYAQEPPAIVGTQVPFLSDTYNNKILYVLGQSVETYRNTAAWGTGKNNTYFRNIVPITTPTFVGNGNWNTADNWRTYTYDGDSYTEQWGILPEDEADVLIDGNVTIPTGYMAITNTINIIKGSITIEDGGQLVHNNSGISATIKKNISGYGNEMRWNTISSPMATPIEADNITNMLSNTYDLYYYDEPTHYWINHKDVENNDDFTTLDAGRGYLYANSENVTLLFKGVINHDDVNFTLDCVSDILTGFNLVGNPFTHNIYKGDNAAIDNDNLAEGYYSLSGQGAWGAVKADNTAIAPCQSVLVQTTTADNLTINKTHKPATTTRGAYHSISINVANAKYKDEAYVMFKDGIGLNKIGHMNENIPMVYVTDNDEHFAIATMNKDAKEINIGFEAMTMGEYTISVNAKDCKFSTMTLTDKLTGEKTDLLSGSYTFMATTTDNPQRFVLTLNSDSDTDTDFIYINNDKMIINNIEGNGFVQIFDIMGRPVAEYNANGSANINIETLANGVYVVRMTDDNGIKTQKIIRN